MFAKLVRDWGITELAADLGLPAKNVRRWVDNDSIPAGWFIDIARAARRRRIAGVTERKLLEMARDRAQQPQKAA